MPCAAGGSAWSFLLQPQGKVDAWLRVSAPADDAFVLDVDGGFGEAVVARLKRFKLRVKVDIVRARVAVRCRPRRRRGSHVDGARLPSGRASKRVDVVGPSSTGRRDGRRTRRARSRTTSGRASAPGCRRWARDHDGHDPGRARRPRSLGELHEGLLHGPGARRPHRLAGRQRPAPLRLVLRRRRRARSGARGRARRPRRRRRSPAQRPMAGAASRSRSSPVRSSLRPHRVTGVDGAPTT